MNCDKFNNDNINSWIKNKCNCDKCLLINKKILLINNIIESRKISKINNNPLKYIFHNNINLIQTNINLLEKKHKIIELLHKDYETLNKIYKKFNCK